jgi:hypothetical protein
VNSFPSPRPTATATCGYSGSTGDDRDAETARHEAFGGDVRLRAEHWTTLRDPAGFTYCITDRGVS